MTSRRGRVGFVAAFLSTSLPAAVELMADLGHSRTRRDDGAALLQGGLQPALLLHPDAGVFPTAGVRAGPTYLVDADTRDHAIAVEASLLGGIGVIVHRVRLDLLGAWGGGYWRDAGAGVGDGWGRSVGAEVVGTWAFDERIRAGLGGGWHRRHLDLAQIEEWRVALALIYRLD